MKSFAQMIHVDSPIELDGDNMRSIININQLIQMKGVIKQRDMAKKLAFIVIGEDEGIYFNKCVIRTVGGFIVDDKDNTSSYHMMDLIEGTEDFIERQRNVNFIVIIPQNKEDISSEIHISLKDHNVKVRKSLTLTDLLDLPISQ